MKKKVFNIEDAEVSCIFVAGNPCGPDEYEVDITVDNLLYRIYTLVGPFEQDEAVCNRVFKEWKNGYHNIILPNFRLAERGFKSRISRQCEPDSSLG